MPETNILKPKLEKIEDVLFRFKGVLFTKYFQPWLSKKYEKHFMSKTTSPSVFSPSELVFSGIFDLSMELGIAS